MKKINFVYFAFLSVMGVQSSHASETTGTCSMSVAKKFAEAIIEAQVEVNAKQYGEGELVFNRSISSEYDASSEGLSADLREELKANPDLRVYRLRYTWKRPTNNNVGFYYLLWLSNYDRGCTLKKIVTE